jgi:chloramphenicol 3-O-phosphotransferase
MGTIVFVTGVPSSGKSAVTRELLALDASFRAIETDVEIRKASSDLDVLLNARTIFHRVLDKVAELAESANVVVDGSLPGSYVTEARDRFGERAFFVTLQIPEEERRSREQSRRDRKPIQWNEGMTALGGGPDLYDLVVNGLTKTPGECVAEILDAIAPPVDDQV